MKNCPKCNVDFDDSFSFCEFDGAPLKKVILPDSGSNWRKGSAVTLRVGGILVITLAILLVFGKGGRRKAPVPASNPPANQLAQRLAEVETPQGARDYVEPANEAANPSEEEPTEAQKNPGVEVFKPETKPAGEAKATKSQPAEVEKPAETAAIKPNPAKTRIGERTPITNRTETNDRPTSRQEMPPPARREPATQQAASRPTQTDRPRTAVVNEPAPQRAASNAVSLHLIRVRSYRTGSGVRYELTFNMQENGGGRLVRWERLSLVSRSASGVTHAEAVPFHQRLGPAGSMTFTVAKEMRGRDDADVQGQISCTGIGTDVEGRPVRATFTARVNP